MEEQDDDIIDTLSRWEVTGLLDGLPQWEKEELAIIYDNITRIILSNTPTKSNNISNEVFEILTNVSIPIVRRLYRRVGVNFDPYRLVNELIISVTNNYPLLSGPITKEQNPIVSFCVQFSDNYEDEQSLSKIKTKEEYEILINNLMDTVKKVLLSNEMVSHVNRNNNEWDIKYTDIKKSPNQVRMWNQKRGLDILNVEFKYINQE